MTMTIYKLFLFLFLHRALSPLRLFPNFAALITPKGVTPTYYDDEVLEADRKLTEQKLEEKMKDDAFFRKEKRRGKIDRIVLNGNDAISGRDLLTAAALTNGGEMTPNIVAAPLGGNGDY